MAKTIVWVADVGSIKKERFGWCRAESSQGDIDSLTGVDIAIIADGVAKDLVQGYQVALGFECPLFVPISKNPSALTSARKGEGSRPWSAGAGCGSLATGLTESVWIFERLIAQSSKHIKPTFDWGSFLASEANLFIWEAFVSGTSKTQSHVDDACAAANSFWSAYPNIREANAVTAKNPFSLVGAALLRSGLINDPAFLSEHCIVLRS